MPNVMEEIMSKMPHGDTSGRCPMCGSTASVNTSGTMNSTAPSDGKARQELEKLKAQALAELTIARQQADQEIRDAKRRAEQKVQEAGRNAEGLISRANASSSLKNEALAKIRSDTQTHINQIRATK